MADDRLRVTAEPRPDRAGGLWHRMRSAAGYGLWVVCWWVLPDDEKVRQIRKLARLFKDRPPNWPEF